MGDMGDMVIGISVYRYISILVYWYIVLVKRQFVVWFLDELHWMTYQKLGFLVWYWCSIILDKHVSIFPLDPPPFLVSKIQLLG